MAKKLTRSDAIVSGDLFVVFKTSAGDYRGVATTDFLTYVQANITVGQGSLATQYSAPSLTGFSVTITDGSSDNTNVHLILTPTATFATGTITLPPVAGLVDKQEVLVNCTQIVTTLTIGANGATAVTGEPATLAANDFFKLKYDLPTKTWYRVG